MEIDNRDIDETWIHVDKLLETMNDIDRIIVSLSREQAMDILGSFYENSGGNELKSALQDLYNWTIKMILDNGCDVNNGKVVERID